MHTYTTAANARRAASRFADRVKGFKAKALHVEGDAETGYHGAVTFETSEQRFALNAENKALLADAPVKIVFAPRERSSIDNPCALVWDLADRIVAKGDGSRKDVLAAAEQQGVNKFTARTQYQKWNEARNAT